MIRPLPPGIVLRDLQGMAEFRAAERLQRIVWGEDDPADPGDLMMVIQHEGGLAAGAFRGSDLLGYVFAFPTRDPAVHHSHRLAVIADARGLGLAAALKWYQRTWCLARGITLVRWTFDPLRHANANLNIGHLGARASTYFADYYGEMEGINKGAPSDRILADWSLAEPSVVRLAAGQRPRAPDAGTLRVPIPSDFGALLLGDPDSAIAERLRLRQVLTGHFAQGLQITGYDAATATYLLGAPTD